MKSFFQSLSMWIFLTVVTGFLYPAVVTVAGRAISKENAEGSVVRCHDRVVGSSRIAQKFTGNGYFWPRPSAADYNAMSSSGSQLGPTSAELTKQVLERRQNLVNANPDSGEPPDDLLLTSGSGLDPDISPEAANFQISRIAKARHYTDSQREGLLEIVKKETESATLGFLGEDRVNVLALNMKLDGCP